MCPGVQVKVNEQRESSSSAPQNSNHNNKPLKIPRVTNWSVVTLQPTNQIWLQSCGSCGQYLWPGYPVAFQHHPCQYTNSLLMMPTDKVLIMQLLIYYAILKDKNRIDIVSVWMVMKVGWLTSKWLSDSNPFGISLCTELEQWKCVTLQQLGCTVGGLGN